MNARGTTWAGTHAFGAASLMQAHAIEHVKAAVRVRGPVRALGTRHSFNDLADTAGTLVSVTEMPPAFELDTETGDVSVGAGTRYGVLATWLEEQGRALHNLGSLPHISIAGATQTGTHGSGIANGCLTTAVTAFSYVDPTGEVRTVTRADEDFPALAVGLGAFGVITRMTLETEPSYDVRQDVYHGISWETLLADPLDVLAAAYSVSVFARWGQAELHQVWVKSRIGHDRPVQDEWLGGERMHGRHAGHGKRSEGIVGDDGSALTERGGKPGPWHERLPHFRLDATPSNGDEIQTEYFVPLADAAAALAAVRELADRIDPLLLITELRTIAADDLWLSGAYQRDTLAIHFTWRNEPDGVTAVLPVIEEALAPFAARPHWGKWHAFSAEQIAAVHPRARDARDVFERLDPGGRFSNDHLVRLGLREPHSP